jgi:hypothetical protein
MQQSLDKSVATSLFTEEATTKKLVEQVESLTLDWF